MVSVSASRWPVTALHGAIATAFVCLVIFAGACSTNSAVVDTTSPVGTESVLIAGSTVLGQARPEPGPIAVPEGDAYEEARLLLDAYAFPSDEPVPAGSIEYVEWEFACLEGFGYAPRMHNAPGAQPGLVVDDVGGQVERFDEVIRACADVIIDSGLVFVLQNTAEDGLRVFEGYVQVYECMVANGFATVEPPSQDAFLSSWVDGGSPDDWHPYPWGTVMSPAMDGSSGGPELQAQLAVQAVCPADWGSIFADVYPGR